MPNIALLNYCNLSCPYCFANEFIEEKKQIITLEQIDKILNFLKTSNDKNMRIGLIGGEPTLHPQFKEIILKCYNFTKQHNYRPPLVFTNGIELEPYIKYFNQIRGLININEPKIIGLEKWNKIKKNLKILNSLDLQKNINIGINIYPDIQDFSYIFEIATKYSFNNIRCSIVAPTCNFSYFKKDEYYYYMKNIFIKFVQQAAQLKIKINLDCNKIPICYFNETEKEIILQNCIHFSSFCQPVIDITPDFKATSCFGTYNPIDLNQFQNLEQLERYFLFHDIQPLTIKNKIGKCKNCEKIDLFSCQGGCLAFAK